MTHVVPRAVFFHLIVHPENPMRVEGIWNASRRLAKAFLSVSHLLENAMTGGQNVLVGDDRPTAHEGRRREHRRHPGIFVGLRRLSMDNSSRRSSV